LGIAKPILNRHILTVASSNLSFISLNDDQFINVVRGLIDDSARVLFTNHAEQRMRQRRITRPQVLRVLRHGHIVESPLINEEKQSWEAALECLTAGKCVRVVAAITADSGGDKIIVITVIQV
jgi:hypothetical protein